MISHYSGDEKGDAKMHASSSKGDDEKGKGGVDIDNLGLDKKKKRKKTFSDLVGKMNLFLRPSW